MGLTRKQRMTPGRRIARWMQSIINQFEGAGVIEDSDARLLAQRINRAIAKARREATAACDRSWRTR